MIFSNFYKILRFHWAAQKIIKKYRKISAAELLVRIARKCVKKVIFIVGKKHQISPHDFHGPRFRSNCARFDENMGHQNNHICCHKNHQNQ